MDNFKPGTLHDGICFDHSVAMYGDGEGRIPPPRVEEEPDMDLEPDDVPDAAEDDAPEDDAAPVMYMGAFLNHLNRLR